MLVLVRLSVRAEPNSNLRAGVDCDWSFRRFAQWVVVEIHFFHLVPYTTTTDCHLTASDLGDIASILMRVAVAGRKLG